MVQSAVTERKKNELLVLSVAYALLEGGLALRSWISAGAIQPIFPVAIGLALGIAILTRLSPFLLAVRIAEILFAIILALAIPWSELRYSGSFLTFVPVFVLLCRYFDGHRAFVIGSAWASLCLLAWYFLVGIHSLGVTLALNFGAIIGVELVLTRLVGTGLDFALVDKKLLLGELHHRMRNLFQVLSSLSSINEAARSVASLRSQVLALKRVQEAIAESADLRTLDLDGALSMVAGDHARRLGKGFQIKTRVEGKVPAERAQPLLLLVSEILSGEVSRLAAEGCQGIELGVSVSDERGCLSVRAFGQGGEPRQPRMALGTLGQSLIAQLKARAMRSGDGSTWSLDFDASEGGAGVTESSLDPALLGSRREGEWSSILGRANRERSRLWLQKARRLARFNIGMGLLLSALVVFSLAAGEALRLPALLSLPFLLVSWLLIRAGHLSSPATLTLTTFMLLMGWSILAGPGHERGVNLALAQAVMLFGLYFLGIPGGLAALLWSIGLYVAWYLFDSPLGLPTDDWLVIVIALLLFFLLLVFVIRDFRKDIKAKEGLAMELQRRTIMNVDILLEAIDTDVARDPDGPLTATTALLDALTLVHNLAWEGNPAEALEIKPLLEALIGKQDEEEIFPTSFAIDLESEGSLNIERALDLLLLLSELRYLGSKALGGKGRLLVRFKSDERRAELRVEAREEGGSLRAIAVGREGILERIEGQLGAVRRVSPEGSYALGFGT
jgi:two-component sensor histidine kinase